MKDQKLQPQEHSVLGDDAPQRELDDLRLFAKVLAVVCFFLVLLPDLAIQVLLAPGLRHIYDAYLEGVPQAGATVWGFRLIEVSLMCDLGLFIVLLSLLIKANLRWCAIGSGIVILAMALKFSVTSMGIVLALMRVVEAIGA